MEKGEGSDCQMKAMALYCGTNFLTTLSSFCIGNDCSEQCLRSDVDDVNDVIGDG